MRRAAALWVALAATLGGCGLAEPGPVRSARPPATPDPRVAPREGERTREPPAAASPSATVSASRPAPPYVAQVRLARRAGVETVVVVPTPAGRSAPDPELVWAEVVRARPGADLPTLHDQLVCHVLFAADKGVWHLEPDRPAVGLPATVASGCNPGHLRDPDVG